MNEAYKLGKQACIDGKSVDKNPFKYRSLEYVFWQDGWYDQNTRWEG